MSEALTPCDNCGQHTKTIGGMCPNCGFVKTGKAIRREPYRPSLTDGIFDLLGSMFGNVFGFGTIVMLGLTVLYLVLRQVTE
jgi:hypothetical protein